MKIKTISLLLGVALCSITYAQTTTHQELRPKQCYEALRKNVRETNLFPEAISFLNTQEYDDLKQKWSSNLSSWTSFGIETDGPLFQYRVLGYGSPTKFTPPLFSPFPISTQSDPWQKPMTKNTLLEEYVVLPQGTIQFVGCGFITLETEVPGEINDTTYAFDGDIYGVHKKEPTQGYTAVYARNLAFDRLAKPVFQKHHLWVYSTQETSAFFNRAHGLDSFFAQSVADFDSFFTPKPVPEYAEDISSIVLDSHQKIIKSDIPIYASKYRGHKKNYFEAIQTHYPQFAEHLAINGVVPFSIYQKLDTEPETKQSPIFAHLWNVMLDSRDITSYAWQKKNNTLSEESPFFETQLEKIESVTNENNVIAEETDFLITHQWENMLQEKLERENQQQAQKVRAENPQISAQQKRTTKGLSGWSLLFVFGGLSVVIGFLFWYLKIMKPRV